ncbi:hypothetical protein QJS04_geneDACA021135 [Acorus gramineus]|uniref:Uncharacterized protein n=1 Tax=Acorus gramineus TaxID=55184 RepID=A0AAV9BRT0_ACOGR|nr:hypothetical protein QJS04_geneDACA021135 [Acorus gramineus]
MLFTMGATKIWGGSVGDSTEQGTPISQMSEEQPNSSMPPLVVFLTTSSKCYSSYRSLVVIYVSLFGLLAIFGAFLAVLKFLGFFDRNRVISDC